MQTMTEQEPQTSTGEFMDVTEVAQRLNLHATTIRRMINQKKIPGGVRIGRVYRINRTTFEKAMRGSQA